MVVGYWIVAGLLALLYLYAGAKKIVQSQEQLAPMMGWVDTVPMPVVRFIGAVEIVGAAGPSAASSTGSATSGLCSSSRPWTASA